MDKIGAMLTPYSPLWAKDITTLPLFGGRLASEQSRKDMSIFSTNHGGRIKAWIREKYSTIQNYIKEHNNQYKDCTKLKTSNNLHERLKKDLNL